MRGHGKEARGVPYAATILLVVLVWLVIRALEDGHTTSVADGPTENAVTSDRAALPASAGDPASAESRPANAPPDGLVPAPFGTTAGRILTIRVEVSARGTPVERARVEADVLEAGSVVRTASLFTGPDGMAVISLEHVPPSADRIYAFASHPDHGDAFARMEVVSDDELLCVNLALRGVGRITVLVKGEDGAPVGDVSVTLRRSGPAFPATQDPSAGPGYGTPFLADLLRARRGTTNARGEWSAQGISAGRYVLDAEPLVHGFRILPSPSPVTVTAGSSEMVKGLTAVRVWSAAVVLQSARTGTRYPISEARLDRRVGGTAEAGGLVPISRSVALDPARYPAQIVVADVGTVDVLYFAVDLDRPWLMTETRPKEPRITTTFGVLGFRDKSATVRVAPVTAGSPPPVTTVDLEDAPGDPRRWPVEVVVDREFLPASNGALSLRVLPTENADRDPVRMMEDQLASPTHTFANVTLDANGRGTLWLPAGEYMVSPAGANAGPPIQQAVLCLVKVDGGLARIEIRPRFALGHVMVRAQPPFGFAVGVVRVMFRSLVDDLPRPDFALQNGSSFAAPEGQCAVGVHIPGFGTFERRVVIPPPPAICTVDLALDLDVP